MSSLPPAPEAPFGAENRQALIAQFLAVEDPQTTEPRWRLVYRLLLWVDETTGLGHCYESDKCQPGKPWYPRSLRFHDWLSRAFECSPSEVEEKIDFLFNKTSEQYAVLMLERQHEILRRAEEQREGYGERGFPTSAEKPVIVSLIKDSLGNRLVAEPTAGEWGQLTLKIREVIAVENKRKNLLGEGLEDVLVAVLTRSANRSPFEVRPRVPLHEVPGFTNRRAGDKLNKVDLAVTGRTGVKPTMVTVKWSIRADRERQFESDFNAYLAAQSARFPFDYTLITNEFDPARLNQACEIMAANSQMFTNVVHINCEAVQDVYGPNANRTMQRVLGHMESGRVLSLDAWLAHLNDLYRTT